MKNNIVLIGHPYAGKTVIGFALSKKLKVNFIDTDKLIELHEQKPISDIVNSKGIDYFRKVENNIVESINSFGNVIATGGGVVLNEQNMNHLKTNSIIINIVRPITLINNVNPNRPLTANKQFIKKIIDERDKLYKKYSDFTINNISSIEDAVIQIIKQIGMDMD